MVAELETFRPSLMVPFLSEWGTVRAFLGDIDMCSLEFGSVFEHRYKVLMFLS